MQPGKIAADVGAGIGFITEELIRRGLRVIAIDQSEEMLIEMKKKFQDVDTIDYRIGKAESLPIEDESVDYVFANMFLHHVEDPRVAIKEMVRILKQGGILVITDLNEHDFEFLKIEHHDHWMGFKRENVKHWFMEAGLKNVKVKCTDEDCCAKSIYGDVNISIFVASGEK